METIHIHSSTKFYLGRNFLKKSLLEPFGKLRRVLIADENIKDLYAVDLSIEMEAELITIPSGERAKSRAAEKKLMEELFKRGCGRDTLLMALGGGATTDLVGFVASIYMRGVPLVFIPTTLLAIVDAAIGGKTAINAPYGKNLIGTYYHPKAIFADLDMLKTLPENELFNGLAEILKMGLIHDVSIWKKPDILKAIRGKLFIVGKDPRDQGIRRILNFGHTIGHALETGSRYEMSHGKAVALGCAAEAHLSLSLGYLPEKEFEQIVGVYRDFPLKLPKTYLRKALLEAMALDKKGSLRFVLIDRIGHAIPFDKEYCRTVALKQLEPTLDWMENWKSSH
jgi:3-dehydroquinate synthase